MNQSKHLHAFMSHSVRHILLLIGLLIATMCFGQVQTQKGVSYRYNGKNPRTPLPSVIIECDAATNTVISDSITGEFSISFQKLKMGDRIGLVKVKKREMMVFNQHAVDEWSIRKDPLCLILCDADEFDRQKQELIAIGKREAQKKYDRQKADLEQQLEASQIDRSRYEAELDTAWQELDRLHKHIDEYADLFARIDQSEIDPDAQRAMDLFNQGQVDEAMRLFEQGQYLEKLKSAKAVKKQAKELKVKIENAEAQATQDSIEAVQSLKAQIAAYKVQNEWEKAKALLKGLADELGSCESLFDYAYFCQNQNDFNEAETYYLRSLSIVRQLVKDNPQAYEPDVAMTLNNLALLYANTQHLEESEAMYLEAMEIYRRLVQSNPQAYESGLACMLNNLANLYKDIQRLTESEAIHLEALEIYRQLTQGNPQAYEPDLANSLNDFAIFYANTQHLAESEAMYLEALEIRRRLAQSNPQAYEPDLARTLNNLAILYSYTQRFAESEAMFLKTLEIMRRLAQGNPQAYEPDLAGTLNNLALLYANTQRFTESEAVYLEALEIRRRLAQGNPQAYEPDVAMTLNNLAFLYQSTQRLTESEAMFLDALEIFSRLAQSNPQAYEPNLAGTLNNIAALYANTQRFAESEAMYLDALEMYRQLAQGGLQAYEPDVAMTHYNIGLLHIQQEQYFQAISDFEEALVIYRKLKAINPSYCDLYQYSLYWLTQLYPTTDNHARYYEINEEWLPIVKGIYQEETESYQEDYIAALGSQSFQCIFVGQLEKSEQYAREALSIDPTQIWINTNLAAALLFQGEFAEAEALYRQYKDEKKDSFLQDFIDFEAAGIIPNERKADVEKIRKLLSE